MKNKNAFFALYTFIMTADLAEEVDKLDLSEPESDTLETDAPKPDGKQKKKKKKKNGGCKHWAI